MPILGSSTVIVTVKDLIKSALRLLQVTYPTADEIKDGLSALNGMVESWNTESLTIYAISKPEYNLVAGTADYTLGDGGDWNGTRPIRIEHALLKSGTTETPIEVLTDQKWAAIHDKTLSGTPCSLYNDRTFPLSTVSMYPVPDASEKVILYVPTQTSRFTIGDDLVLPPGYERALKYNLAVEVSPEFGRSVSGEVAMIAVESKASIKRANSVTPNMECDAALLSNFGTFDIRRGY